MLATINMEQPSGGSPSNCWWDLYICQKMSLEQLLSVCLTVCSWSEDNWLMQQESDAVTQDYLFNPILPIFRVFLRPAPRHHGVVHELKSLIIKLEKEWNNCQIRTIKLCTGSSWRVIFFRAVASGLVLRDRFVTDVFWLRKRTKPKLLRIFLCDFPRSDYVLTSWLYVH